MSESVLEFPDKLGFLLEQRARYKGAHGGRGSAKSWSFAAGVVAKCASAPQRWACAREIQKTLAQSSHQLLVDTIKRLRLDSHFTITDNHITGRKVDSLITFHGLRHNPDGIKSLEGYDGTWVEEAEAVPERSWKVLTPTLRKPGSEIWLTWNPNLKDSATHQRYIEHPPRDSIIVQMNWRDNPWFTPELEAERQDMLARDPRAYRNVWEGETVEVLEGAVYADEMLKARQDGRFTSIPVDRSKPVTTVWDLGFSDATAIWFVQRVGFELRVIDYYEDQHKGLPHYLQVLQERGYLYERHWLPHDGRAKTLGTGSSIQEQMKVAGFPAHITPSLSVTDGIAAARSIFSQCWFDEKRCEDGLDALRNYRFKPHDDGRSFSRNPEHNWASHGADAWRYLAIVMQDKGRLERPKPRRIALPTDWMA